MAAPTFVQRNYATPQSATATVSVSYGSAQTSGDLNVVVVGWNDSTSMVQSVRDSAGNTYSLAIGPTIGTALSQSIYFASNIVGGANTVTVTFNQAAAFPDIRILEYKGINVVDVAAGASGNSTTSSSGVATTNVASELIFGANTVATKTKSAGTGFTSRVLTAPDGDIAEDKVVTAISSNNATATLSSAGPWVMQMVSFALVTGPAPTVTGVSPNSGSTAGGTTVTITGTNFASGATVTFGSAQATGITVVNGTTITATTPGGTAGTVTVTVTVNGQSSTLASGFTYIAPPTVTATSPNTGTTAGGTGVTITGTNFASGATVKFGSAQATGVTVLNNTTITATTPPGNAGAVAVSVTNTNGLSGNLANGFTYIAPPTVTGVSPNSGSTGGGTAVTVTGTNFASGATLTFGGAQATGVTVVNSTTISAITPAGSVGTVTVTVTVSGQSGSLASGYTYVVMPTVSSVSPNTGVAAGGTAVTITGTNFTSGATVAFGSAQATGVTVVNSTTITATTPAGNAGAVTVTVTVNGQSGSLANGFTYVVPPTITSVSPNSGTTAGGTAVTIIGTNFVSGATVTFGVAAATNVAVVNGTTITATTPPGSAGAVTVTVTNPGSQAGSLANGYTYVVVPTVTSVSPNNGAATGGTAVTITGTNFASGATVSFGGNPATGVTVVNNTTITATTPAGSGTVTVTVTVNGQSGSLPNGFAYNNSVAISFVQVAAATPQSSTSTVAVTYPSAQTAGDLNVVVVGWNDTTSTVASVKDSLGNTYNRAIGPTTGTALSESIYYAANIGAGSNTVTVTFNQAAAFPDIRILEYRGVNAVDVTAGASGNSTTANSGSATTTFANELIFGADIVATTTGSAGAGFTSRVITSPDGDIAEDKIVASAGSNNATATLSSGAWVMQMVTFASVTGPAPTVTGVTPSSGTTSGGTPVTITGTNFATGATVTVGNAGATNVVVVSGTQITATTPPGSAGAVTVTVSNPGGQTGGLSAAFTYIAPPSVTGVTPNGGPVGGGTAVTIGGTNFASGAIVKFGSAQATGVNVVSSTSITATTPPGTAGAVAVLVTNTNGLSGSLANGFTYLAPPTVTGVSPSTGSTLGGTAVTISGTNFASGAFVTFGSASATAVTVVNSTTITATTPAGNAGAVTVTVTVSGQSGSLASGYTYLVTPTVTSVSPNTGPAAGGTGVTITGTNFASGATVLFGSAAATGVNVVNTSTITATTPAGSGAVTVTVTVNGQTGSLANGFIYSGSAPTAPGGLTAAGGSGPTVAAVQGYINSNFQATHTTAAFDSTGGDLIVLCASSHFEETFTPSDSLGNTWISIAGPTTTSLGFDLGTQLWYAPNAKVGPGHTVTITLSEAMSLVMSVIVVKGSNTSSPIDAISLIGSDDGTQTINVVSPNVITSRTNDLLVGFTKVSAGATFQPGTGFTQQAAASSNFLDAETGLAVAPGTYAATFGVDSPQTWQAAVVAVSQNVDQANLSWTASSEAGGTISKYLVERCQGANCNTFAQIGTTTTTSYNDTGLSGSVSYSYRVRAQDTNGVDGPYSALVSITTGATIPSLPGNLVASSLSTSEIDLSWVTSTEPGGSISDYLVERCPGTNCSNFVQINATGLNSYADTSVTSGSTYTYRVRAQDAAANVGPYSNLATASAVTPDTQPPTAPGSLTVTPASSSELNLAWTASIDNVGVTGYYIERCSGAGCTNFFRVAVSSTTSYSDIGLSANTTYEYRVRATDAAGNLSSYTSVLGATTLSATSPDYTLSASPSALTIAPGTQGGTTISSTVSNGFNNAISLSASGMPSGTTVIFSPSSIAAPGGGTASLAIAVGASTPTGTYSITVTGSGGGIQHTAIVTLTVSSSTINYVQGNYATPQTAQSSVAVKYNSAQFGGDLNVVVVGWNDSTATVNTVTDTSGNTYTRAVGPTVISGVASQSIYYARNIVAATSGTNTVTVTFSAAAQYADIRILEYSGADRTTPVDVSATSTGNSGTSSSGLVNTTSPIDLLFGANLVLTSTNGPGSGFTSRLLTSPDGDIAEDHLVTTTGAYSATAPLSAAGQWIMQMVAFRTPAGVTIPVASLSTSNISFGSVATGSSSNVMPVTITNVGSAPLSFGTIAIADGNIGDFAQTNTCGSPLAPNGTCTINVTFTPTDTGQRGASLVINDNASGSPQQVSLSGTGTGFGVTPRTTVLTFTMTQQYTATSSATWAVDGVTGGSASSGTITSSGLYSPPSSIGTHTITATSGLGQQASATVYISNYKGTYTHHNDNLRTGQNNNETVLTPANVNPVQFGKLFSYSIDGIAFASPLYVASVNIPGSGVHNVVYVATENDSIYAFDADGSSSSPLWHVSFLKTGVTTVPCADVGECGDIPVQIGITSTPVIDPLSGTMYVVAKTKENSSYVQRLHALDITTGAEKLGGPVVITASVPGTGVDSSGGKETFNSLRENQRTGLLLSNGVVYFAFGSHGDQSPWHGWVLGYNAATLQQVLAYNDTPNGSFGGGGIWQAGGGLATDANGNIYFTTSNGDFDANTGGHDYGDSVVKLGTTGNVLDYFAPYDQAIQSSNNLDLGAGGPVLLVDQTTGPYPHLLISAGKNGTIYVINRDNMGQFQANNDSQIVQSIINALPNGGAEAGNFNSPIYYNGYVYFAAVNDSVRAFQLNNGLLSLSPAFVSPSVFPLRGGAMAISSNGNTNGILWVVQTNGSDPGNVNAAGTLFAYDASNLSDELYDTNESGSRDTMDHASKFNVPLVANGKVFIASQSQLTAYGLLP
ncbi:MAG: beta strand repeat-containing protein [Acidobacteriota bacterium]